MAFLRRTVLLVVIAFVMSSFQVDAGQVGFVSVRNDFPNAKLFLKCNVDAAAKAQVILPPHGVDKFEYYPDDITWVGCEIYAAQPPVYGKFTLYYNNPSLRACYPNCEYAANNDGVTLIGPRLRDAVTLPWQKRS